MKQESLLLSFFGLASIAMALLLAGWYIPLICFGVLVLVVNEVLDYYGKAPSKSPLPSDPFARFQQIEDGSDD